MLASFSLVLLDLGRLNLFYFRPKYAHRVWFTTYVLVRPHWLRPFLKYGGTSHFLKAGYDVVHWRLGDRKRDGLPFTNSPVVSYTWQTSSSKTIQGLVFLL